MKYLLYGTLGLLVVSFVMDSMGYRPSYYIFGLIEWTTRYVLPWIGLYWFIQFVKSKKE
ncbi:hypothetical protein [Salipaludibacillus neizhouensis]|uniref:hypothetical protein n=1 Tax=Salipaludibacillus neizhouensis TaxID=885475 RepID=UPI0016000F92|nr:hypothetical protein [Salipaludibacillus neizhouensis]